jgi:hypothetical protein
MRTEKLTHHHTVSSSVVRLQLELKRVEKFYQNDTHIQANGRSFANYRYESDKQVSGF